MSKFFQGVIMRRKFSIALTVASMLVIFVSFQNCSKINTQSSASHTALASKEIQCDDKSNLSMAISGQTEALVTRQLGVKKLAILLVNFTSNPASQPISVADAKNIYFKKINDFYKETSYGQFSFDIDVFGWYTVSDCSAMSPGNDTVINMAKAQGIDMSQYDL
jgi:hypothetical protein